MQRITAEVSERFDKRSDTHAQSVGQLSYLLACLAGTNRVYAAALKGQAVVVPSQEYTIRSCSEPGNVGTIP